MSLGVLEMHGVRHNGSQKMGSMKLARILSLRANWEMVY